MDEIEGVSYQGIKQIPIRQFYFVGDNFSIKEKKEKIKGEAKHH